MDDSYVAGTLELGIELWNETMQHLRAKLADPQHALQILEREGAASEDDAQKLLCQLQERQESLRDIQVNTTSTSFLPLGESSLIYIYVILLYGRHSIFWSEQSLCIFIRCLTATI